MATDAERREVAERLRGLVTDDSVYATVDAGYVLHAIGLSYKDTDRIYFSGLAVTRLAGLIDPDCEEGRYEGVHTARPVDREALLALADECDSVHMHKVARRIREALGVKS